MARAGNGLTRTSKARAERITEWRDKGKELQEYRSMIECLQQRAKHLAARSTEMEQLADAAKPLYDSLDDPQKGCFRALLLMAAGEHWQYGIEGFHRG